MWDKFSLNFNLVDRNETQKLRKRLGMDVNPWRSFSRIIASYHYLRQEDVLEHFLAACKTPKGSPHLPWDLLIVDECHNLMPSAFGDDSDLCRMLRILAPRFEHRLFLSATPHNGHTRCFTGLLEILDPVRFSQTSTLKPAEKSRVQQVVLRRLKRDINRTTHPPRFCSRNMPRALPLDLKPGEITLSAAFDAFRIQIRKVMGSGSNRRQRAGSFAVEILGKRLLSCSTAFAESWRRCREGLGEARTAEDAEVEAARKSLERDTGDDRETQSRESTASGVVGAWLKRMADDLEAEIAGIDRAVSNLGFDLNGKEMVAQKPTADTRFDVFDRLVKDLLFINGSWRDDERLVVFTEYKTTLDYLAGRLKDLYDPDRILILFGGMDEMERDQVKQSFNDPENPVRILLATDAAAEGLNLQRTARYLLHYDCPWNPSRLEQRNGRLDRHGQGRDVTVYHFVSDQDQDLRFLSHVIEKAHEIREDLGSANEIFDEAAHRRLVNGENAEAVQAALDDGVTAAKGRGAVDADDTAKTREDGRDAGDRLSALAAEVDLDSDTLRDTLESAMAIHSGRPQLDCETPEKQTCRVLHPDLGGWNEVIDTSLRITRKGNIRGPVAKLAFSPAPFLKKIGERPVFCPLTDVRFMHLSHPMVQRALSSLTRCRFPGPHDSVSRWTATEGDVPKGARGLVLLSVEELAVNALRETFHHWVRTLSFPVRKDGLEAALPHLPANALRSMNEIRDPGLMAEAEEILEDVETDLKAFLSGHAAALSERLNRQLEKEGEKARQKEEERYKSRRGELSSLITENTLARLEREIEKLKVERRQGFLFNEAQRLSAIDQSIKEKEEEIRRRTHHYEEVRIQLDRERDRIIKYLLPKRYKMTGSALVFPVCIEVRLPGGGS